MTNKLKYIIVGLSVVSVSGIAYYLYTRKKISELNKKVSSVQEAIDKIQNIDVSDIPVEATLPTEPTVPLMGGVTESTIPTGERDPFGDDSYDDNY